MQKLTNEELIDKIYDHLDAQGTYEAELIRRLNERDELEKQLASAQRAVEDLNKIKILVDSGSINTGDDMKDEGYLLAISDVRDIIYLTRKEREGK